MINQLFVIENFFVIKILLYMYLYDNLCLVQFDLLSDKSLLSNLDINMKQCHETPVHPYISNAQTIVWQNVRTKVPVLNLIMFRVFC